ncbi:uncharacterized protein LOC114320037 [Camellia sinensis]|uniref:uncharacterized protein LOC114320037 n=1 Tax=Camellia sinensis TaxID=4442 RepID=UPI00103564BD|nr:uncharacterized protein LOC114320037 [Camellia sinensis]XP_028122928.1 uncharacterized protein LOC114320037 [Camellia sinensis]
MVEGKKMRYGEVWPVLFPDLLELSSTPEGDAVRRKSTGMEDELENVKMKVTLLERDIESKCARVHELEQRVESMEKILGAQAANMLIGFERVLSMKDAEIARLTKMVKQANTRITDLEDSLDDREVHNVTQSVANSESNHRGACNSRSGDSNGAATMTSSDVAQQSSSHAGPTEGLASPTHQVVQIDNLGEDVSITCADGYVCSSVARDDCKRNSRSFQALLDACDGLDVDVEGTEVVCRDKSSEPSSGPKITSMVRRVKEEPRREYRLCDYEYPNVFGRVKLSDKVRICKSTKPREIYTVEDIDVGRKTWNGFGMTWRHIV